MTSLKEELLEEAKQYARQLVANAQAKVSHAVSDAQAEVTEVVVPFRDVWRNFEAAVCKSARDQPTATLAVFAGMGFILGALWRR